MFIHTTNRHWKLFEDAEQEINLHNLYYDKSGINEHSGAFTQSFLLATKHFPIFNFFLSSLGGSYNLNLI